MLSILAKAAPFIPYAGIKTAFKMIFMIVAVNIIF